MVKFYAFVLSLITFLCLSAPAYAGRLLFWRFEPNENRLIFSTEQGVQPTAELIPNPTRLVINLPGTTLGQPTVNQSLGGVITGIRIGQFDARTTRIVIELAQGYTIDPQQIQIRGLSPTQWTVTLPQPQRGGFPNSGSNNPPNNQAQSPNPSQPSTNNNPTTPTTTGGRSGVQVTSSGLYIPIDGDHRNNIKFDRTRDGLQIKVELEGVKVSPDLLKTWTINEYGISDVIITQPRNNLTLLTLNVHKDSPNWQGGFSRMGGFVLWPQGGIRQVSELPSGNSRGSTGGNNPPPASGVTRDTGKTSIESIEVSSNQLIIKGNQRLEAQGSWTQPNRMYQVRIENADLAPNFKSPTLPSGSPISRLRIWQPDDRTVVLLIEPAIGTTISQLNKLTENTLTLPFTTSRSSAITPLAPLNPPVRNSTGSTSIAVTPPPVGNQISPNVDPLNISPSFDNPPRPFFPVNQNPPPPSNNPVSRGRVVVVIDPGHGGHDSGAVGVNGVQEKRVVLEISRQVAQILEQQGIQVRMTRDSDFFVSLQGRTEMANRLNANLFVSIHANSAGANKPNVNGYETYYFNNNSRELATVIHRNVLRRVDVNDRRVKQARFYVLRTARMPSVLIETGFVTGREDAAKLTNPAFQKQMAEAIAAGIVEYVKMRRM